MTLGKREKVLAVIAAVMVMLATAKLLLSGPDDSIGDLRKQYREKTEELDRLRRIDGRRRYALKQLKEWEQRSLPTNAKLAKSLYQNWLRELTVRAGFDEPTVDPGKGRAHGKVYTAFPYTIRAKADLRRLTRFLFDFYSAGHLHQIRWLSIKPQEDSEKLDLVFTIEALSLPSADQERQLSHAPGESLKLDELSAYWDAIVRRRLEGERFAPSGGLFAAYYPQPPKTVVSRPDPPAPKEPEKPEFDHSRFAKLTGNVAKDGRWEAWLTVQTTGKQWQLSEGDTFEIGSLRGKVTRVLPHAMEFEAEGRRLSVAAGKVLRDAVEVP